MKSLIELSKLNYQNPTLKKNIIYKLHMKDFSHKNIPKAKICRENISKETKINLPPTTPGGEGGILKNCLIASSNLFKVWFHFISFHFICTNTNISLLLKVKISPTEDLIPGFGTQPEPSQSSGIRIGLKRGGGVWLVLSSTGTKSIFRYSDRFKEGRVGGLFWAQPEPSKLSGIRIRL